MEVFAKIFKAVKSLFPTGRAFFVPLGGIKEGLLLGISEPLNTAYGDSTNIMDVILPDNDNFTEDDATDWERRYGLISNPDVPLEDRKQAIIRKMAFPGQAKARQSLTYFQAQLQAAGFNVYVYENLTNFSPESVAGSSILSDIEYGDVEYGEEDYGVYYNNKIVNYIQEGKDDHFNEGGSFRASLIIGGSILGTYANVNVDRKDEFRQLILNLKAGQYVVYLLINYTY